MNNKAPQSYRDLQIWKMARALAIAVHKMTIEQLPKYEMYEVGSQIRRSSKSVSSNIVEGFGRKRYRNEYIKFLTYALSSCDETREHLEMLHATGSLKNQSLFETLQQQYDILGRKINKFRQRVIANDHNVPEAGLDQSATN